MRNTFITMALAALASLGHAGIVGRWEFNGNLNSAMGGSALTGVGGITFESAAIGSGNGQVAKFIGATGVPTDDAYFTVQNPAPANGGGTKTNQYSVVMDVMFPTNGGGDGFISLFQTSVLPTFNDGDWFIRGDGGMGISSDYTDSGNALRFARSVWQRVTLVIDTTTASGSATYFTYINGVLQNQVTSPSSWGLDARFSLGTTFHIFADEDGETNPVGYINALQVRDYAMPASEVLALGGPKAFGFGTSPTGYNVLEGTEFAGSLSSLLASDDDNLQILSDEVTLAAAVEVMSSTPNLTPTSYKVILESVVGRAGLSQSVDVFRYSTNTYVNANGGIAPTSDTTVEVVLSSNPENYVGSNGDVKVKLTWAPINDEDPASDGWLHDVDMVVWDIS